MRKRRSLITVTLLIILFAGMSACSNSSNDAASSKTQPDPESISKRTDNSSQSKDSPSESTSQTENNGNEHSEVTASENSNEQADDNQEQANNIDNSNSTDSTIETKEDGIQEANTTDTVTKIEGRKTAFIEKLDSIQKELDALPEKNDSDKGVTNAMKNYYGRSYEMYDKELNEIYALLKKELSPETMKGLKTEQIKWIEQKEKTANEERLKYNGGTFENVALYISLYESTKERCYKLVNEYMTD
ncbi:hypothetical protein CWR48_19320 [Oceanobacillus arenosus]|uniref:Lysozyme inhibitor LprI-like N-terminal domain-containing protein n=1 Tax=Oceanobacillus arenosus TaxID=1229153 RepID=A0A3D8PGH5_9BACI|nr:lysozyme inhibitor LprI family protein [Oceanobacillus arenosus]RDW15183.1 hypothetical protein CWR48_19320 [Oceanobacillus arenosus]